MNMWLLICIPVLVFLIVWRRFRRPWEDYRTVRKFYVGEWEKLSAVVEPDPYRYVRAVLQPVDGRSGKLTLLVHPSHPDYKRLSNMANGAKFRLVPNLWRCLFRRGALVSDFADIRSGW